MSIPIILDIAISLTFVYLVLSLVASEVQELLTSILEWRAHHLRNAITNLLGEGNLLDEGQGSSRQSLTNGKPTSENQPSESQPSENQPSENQPSENQPSVSEQSLTKSLYKSSVFQCINQQSFRLFNTPLRRLLNTASIGPSYIRSQDFATALIDTLQKVHQVGAATDGTLDSFARDLQGADLPDGLKNNLLLLIERARGKTQDLQKQRQVLEGEIEDWFNSAMERASGAYRRNVKGMTLLIGVAIAFFVNADTVFMVSSLAKNDVLRSSLTQVADQVIASNSEAIACLQTQTVSAERNACMLPVRQELNAITDNLSPLPIGWNLSTLPKSQFPALMASPWVPSWKMLWDVLKALVGWGLTAIAIAMGAPFWFDALMRVINVRNAGRRPDTMRSGSPSQTGNDTPQT